MPFVGGLFLWWLTYLQKVVSHAIPPAAGRLIIALGMNGAVTALVLLVFFAGMFRYDIAHLHRVHRATAIGTVVIVLGIALTLAFGVSETWANFVRSVLS